MSLPAMVPAPRLLHVTDAVSPEVWDRYVNAHPQATGYHLVGWREVIGRAFGHRAVYLAAEDHGQVVGVLPLVAFRSRLFGRFLVSLPFLNYGGIVADDEEVAQALGTAATERAAELGARSVELRHVDRVFADWHPKEHKVAMRLRLRETPDAQFEALDRKVRNQIRKADKSEIVVTDGGAELLDEFYDVFARNMRDLGTPVYARQFFAEVLRVFPDRTRLFAARLGTRTVAASFVYRWRQTLEVPWASSLREFNHLSTNVRLYWEMLRYAVASGCDVFDFGRSTPNEGTFQFKKQWGAEPVPLVWEYWTAPGVPVPDMSPKNAKFQAAIAAWQKLPLPVTRWLGPRIVRNIP